MASCRRRDHERSHPAAMAIREHPFLCRMARRRGRRGAALHRCFLGRGLLTVRIAHHHGGVLSMDTINQSILTLILLVPLAGAVLVAVLPDRWKLPNWIALLTSLITFAFTLHLPAHFISGQPGFQFELNIPWVANPAIF